MKIFFKYMVAFVSLFFIQTSLANSSFISQSCSGHPTADLLIEAVYDANYSDFRINLYSKEVACSDSLPPQICEDTKFYKGTFNVKRFITDPQETGNVSYVILNDKKGRLVKVKLGTILSSVNSAQKTALCLKKEKGIVIGLELSEVKQSFFGFFASKESSTELKISKVIRDELASEKYYELSKLVSDSKILLSK
jgi:hypothetical protein